MAIRLTIRFLLLSVTVFIFNACIREDESLADKVKIIAHRGYHALKLENTAESFIEAYNKGYKHIEFDISFTKDFQPVILHDNPLDQQSDTTGSISDMYLSDLDNISLTGGYSIPVLDSIMRKMSNNFETIFIDLKEPCPDSGLVNFAKVIKKYNAYSNTITTSMNPQIIRTLKNIDPKLNLGADGTGNGFEDNLYECIQQKYKHVLVYFPHLDKHLCYIAQAKGISVYAYTPYSEQEILQSLQYDIDGVMSDNPDLLKQIIEQ